MQKSSGIGRLQDASDVNVTLGVGVDGYVAKFDAEVLADTLRPMLER